MDMQLQGVVRTLQTAIEASIMLAPTEFGLTRDELVEIGSRIGLGRGEIDDALRWPGAFGQAAEGRLSLSPGLWQYRAMLINREDPELRNVAAFDFVVGQLNILAKTMGASQAVLSRDVLIERARSLSIPTADVEATILVMSQAGYLLDDAAGVRFRQGGQRALPSANLAGSANQQPIRRDDLKSVLPHVKDVLARRDDGRARHAEPFPAFAEALERLGYGNFRLWWTQLSSELLTLNPASHPTSTLVLSAAAVEGALTFVVKHARDAGVGLFGSRDFEGDPMRWKLEALLNGAAHGVDPMLDSQTKTRAEGLNRARQRIHAGRMLSEHPTGPPDLRPEEAREAKAVAEQVVRRIIDWLAQPRS
jgi:hypothetical protein